MQILKNTIIKCGCLNQVKRALQFLKESWNLKTRFKKDNKENFTIIFEPKLGVFTNPLEAVVKESTGNIISFEQLLEEYKKRLVEQVESSEIKEKEPDIIEDETTHRVIAVNNWKNEEAELWYFDSWKLTFLYLNPCDFDENEKLHFEDIDYYTSKESAEKALKMQRIRRKLSNLAYNLNKDYKNPTSSYSIIYFENNLLQISNQYLKFDSISSYSDKFLQKAISSIGFNDLVEYFKCN